MSPIAELFKSIHGAIDKSTLIKVSGFPMSVRHRVTKKKFKAAVEYLEINPDHVFFDPNSPTEPFIYLNGPIYCPLYAFHIEALKMLGLKERIAKMQEAFAKWKEEKDYTQMFSMMEKKLLIPLYIEMYHIPGR